MHAVLLKLAKLIGKVNALVLLSISFYALLLPLSLLRRPFTRNKTREGWLERDPLPKDHFYKQY